MSDAPPSTGNRPVLLAAVVPDTARIVLGEAFAVALAMALDVLVVHVDASRRVTARHPDGSVDSLPVDPDADDTPDPAPLAALQRIVDDVGAGGGPGLVLGLAGDPAEEIARLAEARDARMIVVGTRQHGLGHELVELLAGSVAVHLAHHQHRPVLVVPVPASSAQAADTR